MSRSSRFRPVSPPRTPESRRWLDHVVLRAMEKQPEARFPAAMAMIEALTGGARGDDLTAPIEARVGTAVAGATTTIASPGIPRRRGDTVGDSARDGHARGRGAGGAPPRTPPPASRAPGGRPQPSRWGRNLAVVIALIAVLAVAGIVAASMFDDDPFGLWSGDGDGDPTPTERSIPAMPTATQAGSDYGAIRPKSPRPPPPMSLRRNPPRRRR